MELWIRSQDKELLIKTNKIWYKKRVYCEIITSDGMDNLVIGRYATKERCIEILNKIHEILNPELILKTKPLKNIASVEDISEFVKNGVTIITEQRDYAIVKNLDTVVYQMPEE